VNVTEQLTRVLKQKLAKIHVIVASFKQFAKMNWPLPQNQQKVTEETESRSGDIKKKRYD
jgi:hypothetical protein